MGPREYAVIIAAAIAAAASLVVAGFSLRNSRQALEQTRQLTERQRDADLVGRFADAYFASPESRRHTFALHIVDLMKDPGFRKGLRVLVFRDTMTRKFRPPAPVTAFDKDDDDWRVVGDALSNLRKEWADEHERWSFGEWWCEEEKELLKRWPAHDQRPRDLYRYLNDQRLDDRHFRTLDLAKLSRLTPCVLPKT